MRNKVVRLKKFTKKSEWKQFRAGINMRGQIEFDDIKHIEECITVLAENNGYEITDNLKAIAKAKYRFFGNDWKKCPCVKDDNHSCISQACRDDIEKNGVCGCNLYRRK